MAKAAKNGKKPARSKEKATKPKQERLIDDMPKDRVLDAACLQIRDGLIDINEGTSAVSQGKGKALARMEATQRHSYIAHGVRMMYTPGGAKVSAKLVDSDEGREAAPAAGEGNEAGAGE